jgi:formate hydrogenlyase transcriptional activator
MSPNRHAPMHSKARALARDTDIDQLLGISPPPARGHDDLVAARALSVLYVLRAVAANRDRERLFTAIVDALRPVVPFDKLAIILDGPGKDEITPFFLHPRTTVPVQRRSDSSLQDVYVTARPRYARCKDDFADYPVSRQQMAMHGMESFLALPLAIEGNVFAALVFMSPTIGAFDDVDLGFAGELATAIAVAVDHCLSYETIERSRERLAQDNLILRNELHAARAPRQLIAESGPMVEVLRLAQLVAPTDATALILGETGCGKERLAHYIHQHSERAGRPLVSINCAAIPADLIESELFGHEAGAFTGAARRRRGRFELAHQATLFLDEIGELPFEAQAKLLRVLQHQELERLGGSETLRVDVRVIAATNRDLKELADQGTFRPDLYYRLAVFPLEVPPLWARRDDIPALARAFIADAARRIGRAPPHLDGETIATLQSYSWPGNVRELENVIERAVILSGGGILDVAALLEPPAAPETVGESSEAAELRRVLDEARWVIEGPDGAATRLGVHPSTLRSRMRRLGIERPR